MTPGIKGNSSNNSIMGGGCGGDGQPPCPPRFQAEQTMAPVADRSSRSRSNTSKRKAAPAQAPPVKLPPKLKINLPEGHRFRSKLAEASFYENMQEAIDTGVFKSQEQLDSAVIKRLKLNAGPKEPPIYEIPGKGPVLDAGPVLEAPERPIRVPVKEGPKAAPVRGVAAVKAK